MSNVLRTITIIMLVLGIIGIILGVTVGLYRNDQLAKMQATEGMREETDGQLSETEGQTGSQVDDPLTEVLLNGNFHTILLAVGTVLTLISVALFLISIRKEVS